MTLRITIAACLLALLGACEKASDVDASAVAAPDVVATADALAQSAIIIDTHVDVPYRLESKWDDVSKATETGDFDYPRARDGGLNAPFMSIYTPASMEPLGESRAKAEELIDLVYRIVEQSPGKFAIALSPDDIEQQFAKGLISLPMGMENGSPIEGDLANLKHFYDRGIRYITLAHGKSNHIADSSYDENHQWNGLSDFGKTVVAEMNRIGMIVDISHVSDEAFYDVIEISRAPLIASHSSARHFTPGFERNMSDEMIVTLGEHGGLIMINFGSSFITEKANQYSSDLRSSFAAYLEKEGLEEDDELEERFAADYAVEHGPFPFATLNDVLDHYEHVVSLVGVDHVGIGSDFDGVGDSLPVGLKDVSSYPALINGLLGRGFSEQDVRKILGGNLLRVWRAIEAVADATPDE